MSPNSIQVPKLSSVQFLPDGQVLPSKYHTKNMNYYWFKETIINWLNTTDYYNPWQISDTIPLQFITSDLTSVSVNLINCNGQVISTTNLSLITNNAIQSPYNLFQGNINLSAVSGEGLYYMSVVAGSSGITANLISEPLYLKYDWPKTLLFEYSDQYNKQQIIFAGGTGFTGAFRVKGMIDNLFQPEYKGAFYTDQLQDLYMLNALNYGTQTLWLDQVPDYVAQKISRIMTLSNTFIEGTGYSLDENQKLEPQNTVGAPMKYWKAQIRESVNSDGISVNANGADEDATMIISLDGQYFSSNAGNSGDGASIIENVTLN